MKGLLGKFEVIIALVLLAVFIIWSSSKCRDATVKTPAVTAAADSLAQAAEPIANIENVDENALSDALRKKIAERAKADSIAAALAKETLSKTGAPATTAAAPTPAESGYSQLYVTIDKLKIREEPGLKSKVLGELKLFDKVYFLEEVTDTTYQVNLGKEMADEPYVKVKTKRGTTGWVYGAGVHYHKKKREGVLE